MNEDLFNDTLIFSNKLIEISNYNFLIDENTFIKEGFCVYELYSSKGYRYIGRTSNIENRINGHYKDNNSISYTTKRFMITINIIKI